MSNGYKAALERFEAPVRALAFRGTAPPSEWTAIGAEYEDAKDALVRKLTYRDKPVVGYLVKGKGEEHFQRFPITEPDREAGYTQTPLYGVLK